MADSASEENTRWTSGACWTSGKTLCPLVPEPLKDCYCYDMTSQKIPYALHYCAGKYEDCGIYRGLTGEDEPPPAAKQVFF